MKKQFISFYFTLVVLVFFTSCGHKHKEERSESAATEKIVGDTTSTSQQVDAVYQCPMKCEGEKTYDKPGKCPKCGMDLKEIEGHEGHDH